MSTNEKKHPQGYWMAVGISTRRNQGGQTITVDSGVGTVSLT